MHVRVRRRVRIVAVAAIVACVFSITVSPHTRSGVATALLSATVITGVLVTLEIQLNTRFAGLVHQLPVAVTLLFRTICYGLALVLIPLAAAALVQGRWPPLTGGDGLSKDALLPSFALAVGINLAVTLSRLLGNGILFSLFTGRYHRPRIEERIV